VVPKERVIQFSLPWKRREPVFLICLEWEIVHLDEQQRRTKNQAVALEVDSVKYITHYHIVSASLLQVATK
jgi:hypothetical protein